MSPTTPYMHAGGDYVLGWAELRSDLAVGHVGDAPAAGVEVGCREIEQQHRARQLGVARAKPRWWGRSAFFFIGGLALPSGRVEAGDARAPAASGRGEPGRREHVPVVFVLRRHRLA